LLSAVAAALVALAFQPVRRWAQRLANRLVFGARATPYEVLHDFSERVAGSYDTEDVLPRMATVLGEGTGAQRAQVWMWRDGELRSAAAWPGTAQRSMPAPIRAGDIPEMPDVSLAVPVRDEGELLGALSITKAPSEPVSATDERLLSDLALQASLVLRNVRLVEDLRASRGRLVKAQDEERRKLERDIHDGAQQQLVALAVKARLADTMIDHDPTRAHDVLSEVQAETQETLESLRDLARGIYPPLLVDRGLAEALRAQGRKAPMAVSTNARGVGRYPQEIEATVYFCCLEALQNAGKYAEASHVDVTLEASNGALTFAVEDDGDGFDPVATPRGMGLQNMTDRLAAVGGTLEIRSEPNHGTTIRGSLPVAPVAPA
jgi:signal transduction histidine kinase